jgi:hypothetical protein
MSQPNAGPPPARTGQLVVGPQKAWPPPLPCLFCLPFRGRSCTPAFADDAGTSPAIFGDLVPPRKWSRTIAEFRVAEMCYAWSMLLLLLCLFALVVVALVLFFPFASDDASPSDASFAIGLAIWLPLFAFCCTCACWGPGDRIGAAVAARAQRRLDRFVPGCTCTFGSASSRFGSRSWFVLALQAGTPVPSRALEHTLGV